MVVEFDSSTTNNNMKVSRPTTKRSKQMKTQKLALTCIMCLFVSTLFAGTGEIKEKVMTSVSMQAELQLLAELYEQEEMVEFEIFEVYKVYDQDFNLIMQGHINYMEDIDNPELSNLVDQADFLTEIDGTFIYQLEK